MKTVAIKDFSINIKIIQKSYKILQYNFQLLYMTDKVAPYKKLRGGVRFVASIPKTGSGKILRRHLKTVLLQGKL